MNRSAARDVRPPGRRTVIDEPRQPACVLLAALLLQWWILALPLALTGQLVTAGRDPQLLLFWVLVSAWVTSDAGSQVAPHALVHESAGSGLARCRLAGLGLLLSFWLAEWEHAGAGPGGCAPWQLVGPWQLGGTFLMATGIMLRRQALRTLGPFFVSRIAAMPHQPLLQHGIYSRLRHPSEAGLLAIGLGAALLLQSWLAALWVAGVLLPLSLDRMVREDRVLASRFGAEFASYRQRVAALVPCPRPGRRTPSQRASRQTTLLESRS